jgi:hypothetical protein
MKLLSSIVSVGVLFILWVLFGAAAVIGVVVVVFLLACLEAAQTKR